jgi:soluble lytic murein transglycosylase-like protein
MSLSVENLSLLGALAPLRQKPDGTVVQQENGFSKKLDKAIGSGETPVSTAGSNARELAESLTLQMLQSSLSLSGDSPSDGSAAPGMTPLSSTRALMDAYRANLYAGGEKPVPPSAVPPSQLQELADGRPVADSAVQPSQTRTDVAWLDPIIAKASRKYGVDVGLIKAVIKAESDFNPQAVSHAGARGLMQLMPSTARSLGVSDSFDPEQNVMGGTRFLKDLLRRYDGNVDAALAAYNWGPGNVDKRPDHLPRETRSYLARVKQLYASYIS